MIYPVTRWFKIRKYNEKMVISITNLVKLRGYLDTVDQWK